MRAIVERLNMDYKMQVPESIFFQRIMHEMDDASPRTVREVCRAINRLGWMQSTNFGVWEFTGEFAPKAAIEKDDKELAEREVGL